MKTFALILGGITALAILGALYNYQNTDISSVISAHDQFLAYKQANSKSYSSMSEHIYRFKVFQANLQLITDINADKKNTYTAAVNQFADQTFEELSAFYLSHMKPLEEGKCTDQKTRAKISAPDSINWTDQGKVQAVKNQGNCGSCWAFSAVGAIESALAISSGNLSDLSEQELVDCSKPYGNEGCNGGLMNSAFDYVIDHHINDQTDYPYKGRDQACKTDTIGEGKNSISGCVKADATIDGLVEAIAVQPVAVAFHVSNGFFFYHGGVYNPWFCIGEPNHGVLAVGYNKTEKTPFYIVKNSWGASWGEQGFFRIAFGKGKGTCDIAGNGFNFYPLA